MNQQSLFDYKPQRFTAWKKFHGENPEIYRYLYSKLTVKRPKPTPASINDKCKRGWTSAFLKAAAE
jgi:hypothetical protein